jgi:hypothetical protein
VIRAILWLARAALALSLLRLAIACFLLWAIASDTGARLARMQYAALPDFDYAAEVAYLRAAGRYGEALVVADAGLDSARDPVAQQAIRRERDLALAEQQSLARRARALGMGAISGRGDSVEALIGAIVADFFIVGDVRDIALEGGRYLLDGDADEVILALSALGVATTLAPHIDWAPAVLKAARKAGMLTRSLADQLAHLVRAGKRDELLAVAGDLRTLAQRASPGGAVRLLRHADSADDLATMARFVENHKHGAFALHITGKQGATLLRTAARTGEAGAGQAVLLAAAKGQHGAAWLRTGAWRGMMRPHLLIGAAKGLWKGNVQDAATRIAARIDPYARWLIPLLAAWMLVELALLLRRLAVRGAGCAPPAGRSRQQLAHAT